MRYRTEIDGLRALAVLPVIFFHGGFETFTGGFVGVDIFFVISGYLITSIILFEIKSDQFQIINFYERRARRIIPALFVVMLTCLPFSWFILMPEDLEAFSKSLIAVSLFSSNFLFWHTSGYFDIAAELNPLLHTWSLAVEEQYYILFPIFLLLAWQYSRRWITLILSVIMITSLLAAQWGSGKIPTFTFFMLPTRGWELLIGALVALYLARTIELDIKKNIANQILSLLGVLLIFYAVFVFDKETPFPSFYTLVPTIGTALIICFSENTYIGKLLSCKPIVTIGLMSYSAYLWHQPLIAFGRHADLGEPTIIFSSILVVATFILAYFTWRYVEIPCRNRTGFKRINLILLVIIGTCFFVAIGLTGYINQGFKRYYFDNRLNDKEKEVFKVLSIHTKGNLYSEMYDNGNCIFWDKTVNDIFEKRFQQCAMKYGEAVLVLGDSHAMNIYNSLAVTKFSNFLVGVSQGGCRPHNNYKHCHYSKVNKFIANNKQSINKIIFHQSGSYFIRDSNGHIDSTRAFYSYDNISIVKENIRKDIDYLNYLSSFTHVVWLGPYTEARVNLRNFRQFAINGFHVNKKSISNFRQLEVVLENEIANNKNIFSYVSLFSILKIKSDFLKVGECVTFRDTDHLSKCGELLVGERIKVALLKR